jgi:Flp pilus assembly protein TadG
LQRSPPRNWNFRRIARNESGATAIEFAIVVGPFLFIIGSIIEVGVMLFADYTLQNAVQEASRQIQIGEMKTATASDFKTLICENAPNLTSCSTKVGIVVQNAANFTELAATIPANLNVPPGNSTPFNTGTGTQAVFVMATYDWTFTFPFMQVFNNVDGARRLSGTAVFMNEAFE